MFHKSSYFALVLVKEDAAVGHFFFVYMNGKGFITKKERRPTTLKREGRREQQKGRGALRGGCRGGEGRRRRRKGEKGGSIGKRNRRREGISRARAIPGKSSTREKRR